MKKINCRALSLGALVFGLLIPGAGFGFAQENKAGGRESCCGTECMRDTSQKVKPRNNWTSQWFKAKYGVAYPLQGTAGSEAPKCRKHCC